jgi:uncharacterized protein (DUF302 family)
MKTLTSALDADTVVEHLKQGVEETGLRIVAQINGQANALLIGKEVPADQILEIFRPDFAVRVWAACKPAGIDIPLRIHVYGNGSDTCVACRMPSEVFASYANDALAGIGVELDSLFLAILERVPTQ